MNAAAYYFTKFVHPHNPHDGQDRNNRHFFAKRQRPADPYGR